MDNLSKLLIITTMLLVILACLGSNIVFVSCEQQVTLTDSLQRSVNITIVPKRVITLAPSITETMAYLGVDNYIIGADSISFESWYMNIGSKLRERGVKSVGGYWWSAISVDDIIALQPDLVLAEAGAHKPLLSVLESHNITVFYLYGGSAKSLNEVYSDIYNIGVIFNRTEDAINLINKIENSFVETRKSLQDRGLSGLKILIVIDFWQGIWVAGKATFLDDVLSKLGLVNAASIYGWGVVNIEQVASWNPDLILVANMTSLSNETVAASGLYNLGKPVIILSRNETDVLVRPGPLLTDAPTILYNAISSALKTGRETPTETTSTSTAQQITPEAELMPQLLIVLIPFVALVCGLIGYYVGYKRGVKR
ncbi:MAG: ABC transporter substrate-binding protein [Desulfurococcaceae archaeon]